MRTDLARSHVQRTIATTQELIEGAKFCGPERLRILYEAYNEVSKLRGTGARLITVLDDDEAIEFRKTRDTYWPEWRKKIS